MLENIGSIMFKSDSSWWQCGSNLADLLVCRLAKLQIRDGGALLHVRPSDCWHYWLVAEAKLHDNTADLRKDEGIHPFTLKLATELQVAKYLILVRTLPARRAAFQRQTAEHLFSVHKIGLASEACLGEATCVALAAVSCIMAKQKEAVPN